MESDVSANSNDATNYFKFLDMKHIFLTVSMFCLSLVAFGWGQKGHDTVAFIAENHLTDATKAALDSLLDGKSPVYWANWLDNASHTPEYAYTKTWHYKNVDADRTYDDMPPNPAGDAILAIKSQIETLKNPATNKAEAALALKILIHVVGDMHQPMHMGMPRTWAATGQNLNISTGIRICTAYGIPTFLKVRIAGATRSGSSSLTGLMMRKKL